MAFVFRFSLLGNWLFREFSISGFVYAAEISCARLLVFLSVQKKLTLEKV